MFDSPMCITRGINNELPPVIIWLLWGLIKERKDAGANLDYLQIFQLCRTVEADGTTMQIIDHSQEEPPYQASYSFATPEAVNAKVYVIDDVSHATMLLAEEY